MKQLLILPFIFSSILFAELTMPKHQKFYISGVEFDTKVYCADFANVIEQQAQKIKKLEQEIVQLRKLQQEQLSEKLEKSHQKELKKAAQKKRIESSSSKIIISDKPIK
jgi:NCAIR mutase (PurE)-related protein